MIKRQIILFVCAVTPVAPAFGAYAYVTTPRTVTATSFSARFHPARLHPGGSTALSGKHNNANASPVFVTAVTASVAPFSSQADPLKPACTQADFYITGTARVAAQLVAGTGVTSWSGLTLNMINTDANQDNCKNITLPLTLASGS